MCEVGSGPSAKIKNSSKCFLQNGMFTFPEMVINFLGGSTSDAIMLTNMYLINNV